MQAGDELMPITRSIDQTDVDAYAEAAGDFNPIHIDEEFATTTQFGGTIAHGMMVATMLSELMATEFKRDWANTGKLKIRFRAPVRPGDTVTAHGQVKRIRHGEGGTEITCTVGVRDQVGEAAISGDATVTISNDD